MNFAVAMVKQLEAWGVRYVFGVTGDDILPFLDAIAREGKIQFIAAAHEAGAAFMAVSQARLSGGLAVCTASAAGAVNLLQGVAEAYLDGVPVLALTGQTNRYQVGLPVKQYFNQQQVYAAFTDLTEQVTGGAAGWPLLIRAMSQALLKELPCHLSVSKDVWEEEVDGEPGILPVLVQKREQGAINGDLDRALGYMVRSRRPLIVAGREARQMEEQVLSLADRWGAAIIMAQEAKGIIPDSHPRIIGGIGEAYLPPEVGECDCVLLIGAASFEESFLPAVPVIQLHREARLINNRFLWDSLAGDLYLIITALIKGLSGFSPDNHWQELISAAKENWLRQIEQRSGSELDGIHPVGLMQELSSAVAGDAVISLDVGALMHWFDLGFRAQAQEVMLSPWWRSMGRGLPGAIGAQLLYPGRQVIALVGDGGIQMTLGELTTLTKYRLPVKVIVITNKVYGLEKDKTLSKGMAPLGLETGQADFAAVAAACGLNGTRISKPLELKEGLRAAFAHQGPALVEIDCLDVRLPEVSKKNPKYDISLTPET